MLIGTAMNLHTVCAIFRWTMGELNCIPLSDLEGNYSYSLGQFLLHYNSFVILVCEVICREQCFTWGSDR